MIKYETDPSPFFVTNKNYCENIELKLKTMDLDCAGFCNAYGYEMITNFEKNNLIYQIKIHKHQSTQNGVAIPVDAIDYVGFEIIVSGLNNKFEVAIGKSLFIRLFTSTKFKDKIQKPYFMKFNYEPNSNFLDNLVRRILENNISVFKLNNGTLVCKMHSPQVDLTKLITDIDKTIENWL